MLRVLRVVVVVAALAAPAVVFGREKVVHLEVDGRARPVRTYASTAPDLLRRVGVPTGGRMKLVSSGRLEPGDVVRVRSTRTVNLVVDGRASTVQVHGLTVGESLAELGMDPSGRDFVSPSLDDPVTEGMDIVLRNAAHVRIVADGRTRDIVSSHPTIGDILRHAGVKVGAKDKVSPALDAYPAPDTTIRITRVRERIEEKRSEIPFTVRTERDAKLEKGVRKVIQRGAEGIKVRRTATILHNGKAVARRFIEEKVLRKPRDEIVKIGTGQPSFSAGGHKDSGIASWYRHDRLIAAHKSLPMGTRVRVRNVANGRTVVVVIRDRGPYVDGRIIDLSSAAFEEIAPLGSGTARVEIEW